MSESVTVNGDRVSGGSGLRTTKDIGQFVRYLLSTKCPDQGFRVGGTHVSRHGHRNLKVQASMHIIPGGKVAGLVLDIIGPGGAQKLFLTGVKDFDGVIEHIKKKHPSADLRICPALR